MVPRSVLALALASLAILFASCSGDDAAFDVAPDATEDELFVSNGAAVLGRSADRFSNEVTTSQGEITMSVTSAEGKRVDISMVYSFEAPDKLYMVASLEDGPDLTEEARNLGEFEYILRDGIMYMKIANVDQWFSIDPEQFGFSEAAAPSPETDTISPFDYQAMVEAFGDVEFVGREVIRDKEVLHYRAEVDIGELRDSVSAMTSSIPDSDVDEIGGSGTVDVWVGAEDYLPYKMTSDNEYTGDIEGRFLFIMEIKSYGEPVDIPDAPDNAIPFEDLLDLLEAAEARQ